MKSNAIVRVGVILFLVFAFALLLIGRLYFLQIMHGDDYSARADRQYVTEAQSLYDRGSIFFEDKDGRLISAATLKSGFLVAINPDGVEDPAGTYKALREIIELDEETFLLRAGKTNDPYEEIARQIEEGKAKQIESLDLPGVRIYKER